MIEEQVDFCSDGLRLEGVLSYDEDTLNPPSLLLCPPHPHLGGDMDNNVITVLGHVLAERGFTTMRFNYRGVGNSEGKLGNIAEEYRYWEDILNNDNYSDAVEDAASALYYLEATVGMKKTYVTGYSFGAIVAMMLSVKNTEIGAFASISAPFGRFDPVILSGCKIPKLFICADNDFASSVKDVEEGMLNIPGPKTLNVITDCDHFYIDREHEIADMVYEFYK